MQDALLGPQPSTHKGSNHSLSPCSTQKLPSKVELLTAQSKSMRAIACSMEARIKKKQGLFSLKMDIKMEKEKIAKIANLKHGKDLGVISEAEFRSQVRVVIGLGLKGTTT